MTQTSSSAPPAKTAARTSELSPGTAERLSTDDGKITVSQSVVQKIAGIASVRSAVCYAMACRHHPRLRRGPGADPG